MKKVDRCPFSETGYAKIDKKGRCTCEPAHPKTVTIEYHTGGNGQEVEHTIEAQVCPNCAASVIQEVWIWDAKYCIECTNCGMSSPLADTIPAAVELWNRITMS